MPRRVEDLEHDSLHDEKEKKPKKLDEVSGGGTTGEKEDAPVEASQRSLAREEIKARRGLKEWCSIDNPAIWDGDVDLDDDF